MTDKEKARAVADKLREFADLVQRGAIVMFQFEWEGGEIMNVKLTTAAALNQVHFAATIDPEDAQ